MMRNPTAFAFKSAITEQCADPPPGILLPMVPAKAEESIWESGRWQKRISSSSFAWSINSEYIKRISQIPLKIFVANAVSQPSRLNSSIPRKYKRNTRRKATGNTPAGNTLAAWGAGKSTTYRIIFYMQTINCYPACFTKAGCSDHFCTTPFPVDL